MSSYSFHTDIITRCRGCPKATHAGPVLGKALASFNDASGTVPVLVGLSYWGGPTAAEALQGTSPTVSSLVVSGELKTGTLTVSGKAEFKGTVTIAGDTVINGTLVVAKGVTLNGTLTLGDHLITTGTAPTAAAEAAAGAGATCDVTGNDTSGKITIVTGSTGLTDGLQCTLTFHKPFAAAPNPVVSARDKDSAKAQVYADADTTSLTIQFAATPTPATIYRFNYFTSQ